MADIRLKCAKCGKEVAVSQFANLENLKCSCGEKYKAAVAAQAQAEAAKPKRTALSLKSTDQMAMENAPPEAPDESSFHKVTRKDPKAQKEPRNIHLLGSWLVFLIIAAGLGYARYSPGVLSPANMAMLKEYGIAVFAVLYVTIILKAFKDTVYQGLLCLIPFYPFYYIIMICDDFYLRAVVAGALVGVGQDSFVIINQEMQFFIERVQRYIASGG